MPQKYSGNVCAASGSAGIISALPNIYFFCLPFLKGRGF
jgi:hypothetical protein